MTAALEALTRLDDGLELPGDRELAEIFERHCRQEAFVPPPITPAGLVCDGPDGPECGTCTVGHDLAVARSADV